MWLKDIRTRAPFIPWSAYEDLILEQVYPNFERDYIKEQLPQRTWGAIVSRASFLKLKKATNKCILDFKKIDTEEKAYILGFVAADGCIIESRSKVPRILSIGISSKDIDLLKQLRDLMCPKKKIKIYESKSVRIANNREVSHPTDIARLEIYDENLCKQLGIHNIVPRKSKIIKPPNHIPARLVKHYVRGYFDGDGCVHYSDNNIFVGIYSGSISLLLFIQNTFNEIARNKSAVKTKKSGVYYLHYTSENARSFLGWIYEGSTLYLERKYNIYQNHLDTFSETNKYWTQKDLSSIQSNYPTATREKLMDLFPERTWGAIKAKAHRLGLKMTGR